MLTILVVIFAGVLTLFLYTYNWSSFYQTELLKLKKNKLEHYCKCPNASQKICGERVNFTRRF